MLFSIFSISAFAGDGFTQADRERAIRTEVTLQEYMKATDKRFESLESNMNARFEASDKRFDDTMNYLNTLIYLFAGVMGGLFIYVIWDRKTFLNSAALQAKDVVDSRLNEVQREGKLVELINAMRELAKEDPKVKNVLMKFHLL